MPENGINIFAAALWKETQVILAAGKPTVSHTSGLVDSLRTVEIETEVLSRETLAVELLAQLANAMEVG